jgi:hypothetical protein
MPSVLRVAFFCIKFLLFISRRGAEDAEEKLWNVDD